jgi:flagellar motility protein MotE (MotC chaperone)
MKPEAAEQQLMAMDDSRVSIVLTFMLPRTASQILNEMNPRRAAQITANMLSQGKVMREK